MFKRKQIKNKLKDCALKNNKEICVVKDPSHIADFNITIGEKKYLAKIVHVNKNCDLQINNIDTFVVYKKTLSGNYKANVISNMTTFMKSKNSNKIILLDNKAKTIKKVINESEMIMVNSNTDVYGVNIYNFDDYSLLINDENTR